MIPQVELFSFIFQKNWRHQKDISKLFDFNRYVIYFIKLPFQNYVFSSKIRPFLTNGMTFYQYIQDKKYFLDKR